MGRHGAWGQVETNRETPASVQACVCPRLTNSCGIWNMWIWGSTGKVPGDHVLEVS
jgi:hypothetical protein